MLPHQQNSRIDVADLKAQIVKKIGPERSKRYFYYLNRLLSQKLSKAEFDRFCFRVLGRENLPLHNQFIRSILNNACHANSPPPVHEVGPTKSAVISGKSSPTVEYGREQSGLVVPNQTPGTPIWPNGVVLPLSPRKGRSAIRDRKLRDRPSPLGPNGKPDAASHQSTPIEEGIIKTGIENGNLVPCDYQRPLQHMQGLAEQSDSGIPRVRNSTDAPLSLHGKDQYEVAVVADGEGVEQSSRLSISRSPLIAPLGIPFCTASVGGARKALPLGNTSNIVNYFDSGGLSDSETLRKHMEQVASVQGLGGVTVECANTLNNMLDVYLKRLIRSCVELVGVRSGNESKRQSVDKRHIQGKLVNGMWPSNHGHMQRSGGFQEATQGNRPTCSISLLDFKVAMELKPQQLGEDWPSLLEKISMNMFKD
ncbi:uncharacterized protein LOC127812908 [Diospyros lotus]|uniref:uncharacterized protein LOC127812908 n=1 Tax=Diospyros lotus TaxID=55363 RepID=UPI00225C21BE|nr:uncharacterized protein LOC127812908 [Diospyros lotus]XP_052209435.1 uncharacterized protein LOC127812908 [Diospyros lotus]XP_052209436.1 uncharacterized protein LOC127812908 [Diospyros lotus]XP_052209437.1 uncharacterized protein LOC127812908 [Diospyros lotus]XP_052209438.1 uncharacterized protein LOC127812908 [Diospyros lotus]